MASTCPHREWSPFAWQRSDRMKRLVLGVLLALLTACGSSDGTSAAAPPVGSDPDGGPATPDHPGDGVIECSTRGQDRRQARVLDCQRRGEAGARDLLPSEV